MHDPPRSDDASAQIAAEIEATGPIPFERFMHLALYGESGFYTRTDGGSAGRRGDFLTSPEVGPLFGAVLARYLDAHWTRIGRPDPFTIVDVGAGPGTLARTILAARPECADAMRYLAVEVSAPQRARHPDGVESLSALPTGRFDGVVIANELLDNLAFRLAVFDHGWRESFVDVAGDGRFSEVLSTPLDPASLPLPADPLPAGTMIGARLPLVDQAREVVDELRTRLRSGSLLAIDYGVASTTELAQRPWREWLRTYKDNRRGAHYLHQPGSQDITTDVPIDQLPAPDLVQSQAQFLRRWGIDELVADGKRVWEEQAARPGLDAIRMRSRIGESEALLDPAGLGGFLVAEWQS